MRYSESGDATTSEDKTNCIVTGGAGFIGGHLIDTLIARGDNVFAIDNLSLSKGNYRNPKAAYIIKDMGIWSDVDGIMGELPGNATIFHLAANGDIPSSFSDPWSHYKDDVTSTLNAMELARRKDASRFLFSSSQAVFGEPETIPIPENGKIKPLSIYGLFKSMAEQIVEYYSRTYGIKSTIFRFSNVTGGRVTHGVVHNFVERYKANKPVQLWVSGEYNKNYIYVLDLVDSIMVACDKQTTPFEFYNLGGHGTTSVSRILEIMSECTKTKIESVYEPPGDMRGDPKRGYLDVRKIEQLGWRAKYDSDDAVRQAFKDKLGIA